MYSNQACIFIINSPQWHMMYKYRKLSTVKSSLIWGRCNLKRSRRTVIFLPVYKRSSLKITPPKTPISEQFSYPLPNIVSFLFRLEFRFRSRDFSFNSFPVWQPYCWRFRSAIVVHIHTSTINAPELRERINIIIICDRIKINCYHDHSFIFSRSKSILNWCVYHNMKQALPGKLANLIIN